MESYGHAWGGGSREGTRSREGEAAVNWWRWFFRGTYPGVDRRMVERRGMCCAARTEEEKQQDRQERIDIDRRLHRISRELDVLRREG